MNSVNLIGNLGGRPELRYVGESSMVTKFSVCINTKYKGKQSSDWFNVECWGKTALFANDYLDKGNRVAIQGSLKSTTWVDDKGVKQTRVLVNATRIENLSPKKDDPQEVAEDDLEF